MISARTKVTIDRLNMALGMLVTIAVFGFLAGLVVGVPGLVALFEWLGALLSLAAPS